MFSYTMTILMSLMMFMMILSCCQFPWPQSSGINEVLTTKATIVSPENGIKEVADGSINFEDVTFAYTDENGDKTHVLQGINLPFVQGK